MKETHEKVSRCHTKINRDRRGERYRKKKQPESRRINQEDLTSQVSSKLVFEGEEGQTPMIKELSNCGKVNFPKVTTNNTVFAILHALPEPFHFQ